MRAEPARARRGPAGFTLIEVLAALVVVAVAAVAVAGMGAELRAELGVRRHLEAVALAEQKLGEVAALPTASLLRLGGDGAAGRFAEPFGAYRWRARAGRTSDAPAVVRAEVAVEWVGGQYVLTTEVYRPSGAAGAFPRAGPP
jgi:prepilin-type N-terminal cleavage/methylation domain-containing protein